MGSSSKNSTLFERENQPLVVKDMLTHTDSGSEYAEGKEESLRGKHPTNAQPSNKTRSIRMAAKCILSPYLWKISVTINIA